MSKLTEKEIEEISSALKSKVDEGLLSTKEAIETLKAKQVELQDEVKVLKSKSVVDLPGCNDGKDKGKFSFAKALYAIATGYWDHAQFEKDVFDQARKRALSVGTDSAGGYIVPVQYVAEMIELLRANLVTAKMGATIIEATSSPLEIPRQTGGATAYWVAENAAITASQQTLGQISMQPNAVAALVKASNRLVDNSNPSVEAMIRQDIMLQLALAADLKFLNGDGTGNTPIGIINQPSINTYASGANGDDPTYDLFLELEGLLDDDNALRGKLGYVSHPKVFRKLKKQKIPQFSGQTDGQPVFAPIINDAMLAENLGYAFAKTTQLPTNGAKGSSTTLSKVIFGNWSELLIAMWGSLTLDASRTAGDNNGGAFTSNQTWFKAVLEVDCAVRHAESFAVATDVETV